MPVIKVDVKQVAVGALPGIVRHFKSKGLSLLALCERLEEGDPSRIALARALSGDSPQTANLAQADALRWANSIAGPRA